MFAFILNNETNVLFSQYFRIKILRMCTKLPCSGNVLLFCINSNDSPIPEICNSIVLAFQICHFLFLL